MTPDEEKALMRRYEYLEKQRKRWDATHLNPTFNERRDNFGVANDAPPGFDLVELDEDENFVFFPIEALLYTPEEEVVGAIASVGARNWDEPVNADSGWFKLRVMRHPNGAIEFWGDKIFLPGDEREALAYARKLLALEEREG
jgi:hypothetical protein